MSWLLLFSNQNDCIMKELQEQLRDFISKRGGIYRATTPACIRGERVELTEVEVRMVQVLCSQTDDFEQFCKDYQIFSIDREGGEYLMEFRKDGIFYNEFYPGFYDTCFYLTIEIL